MVNGICQILAGVLKELWNNTRWLRLGEIE